MNLKSKTCFAVAALSTMLYLPAAYALPTEICEMRAALVRAAAVERDKGVSKKKVIALTVGKLGPNAKGFAAYVDAVYANPDISPDILYKFTYMSCVKE